MKTTSLLDFSTQTAQQQMKLWWRGGGCETGGGKISPWCYRKPLLQGALADLTTTFLWCHKYRHTGIPLSWKLYSLTIILDNGSQEVLLPLFCKQIAHWLYLVFGICLLFYHPTTPNTNFLLFSLLINISDFSPQITVRRWKPLTLSQECVLISPHSLVASFIRPGIRNMIQLCQFKSFNFCVLHKSFTCQAFLTRT